MKNTIDINRANYENYVIDYLEGLLSPDVRNNFIAFLENNPDIEEEIDNVNEITLKADKRVFSEKDNLKKIPVSTVNDINEDNYEEFFVGNYENDLSATENQSLQIFLDKNPSLMQEFDIYGSLKLLPEKDITFSEKESLKKKSKLSPVWYSAAAIFIILFTSYWFIVDQQLASPVHFSSVKQIIPKTFSNKLSIDTHPRIETQARRLTDIPASENDNLRVERDEILLASVEGRGVKVQFVDVYDFARIVEHKETHLLARAEDLDNSDLTNTPVSHKRDKKLLASVFNNQFRKIGARLGFNKNKSKKSTDPAYVQVFDKGLTVFNTITGSETSTVKTYNMYGELTSYQVEGKEVLLSKNSSGKSSQ